MTWTIHHGSSLVCRLEYYVAFARWRWLLKPDVERPIQDMAHVPSLVFFCLIIHPEKLVCVIDVIVCKSGNLMSWGVLSACRMSVSSRCNIRPSQ